MNIEAFYYREFKDRTLTQEYFSERSLLTSEIENRLRSRFHSTLDQGIRRIKSYDKDYPKSWNEPLYEQFIGFADEAHLLAQRCHMNIQIYDESMIGVIHLTGNMLRLQRTDELSLLDIMKNLFTHAHEVIFSTVEENEELLIDLLFFFPLYTRAKKKK